MDKQHSETSALGAAAAATAAPAPAAPETNDSRYVSIRSFTFTLEDKK